MCFSFSSNAFNSLRNISSGSCEFSSGAGKVNERNRQETQNSMEYELILDMPEVWKMD